MPQLPLPEIHEVGIVGAGVMGSGIAQVFALAGYRAVVRDIDQKYLDKGKGELASGRYGLGRAVERGKISPDQARLAESLVKFTLNPGDLAQCDLVIEAVPENKDLKLKTFAELDALVKPDAIFASNTSGFSIGELARAVKRRDRFLGLHFFSPVPVMRVCEVIHQPETSEAALKAAEAAVRKAGKETIQVKDAPGKYGFVANRIYFAMIQEAQKVAAEGIATPADIDKVMTLGYNWPAGPFGMVAGAKSGWGKK